jgi:glycosyltransferase involved in cell wall biosynthesis
MGACWRALGSHEDIDLSVLAWGTSLARNNVGFDERVVAGVPGIELVADQDPALGEKACALLQRVRPDVVLVAGWGTKAYRQELIKLRKVYLRKGVGWRPKVLMGMDTPWRGGWRQYLARVALSGYFKGIDGALVAGVGAQEYARRLGFSSDRIYRGLYAWDESMALRVERSEGPDRAFLFVGRYVPAKGLDVLLDAYSIYRKRVSDPWELWCCGAGPMGQLLSGREGVEDHGFVQPEELPLKFSNAGVFVLPSLYEPWGVAIAEAMGCGLPVICTDRCGAGWDLVKEGITGWRIKSGDVEVLADALHEAHRNKERLRTMGYEAKRVAGGFTAQAWGQRIRRIAREFVSMHGGNVS